MLIREGCNTIIAEIVAITACLWICLDILALSDIIDFIPTNLPS